MPVASSSRFSIGSFHATIAGALNGDSSLMRGVVPVDPHTADVEVGLAGAGECLDRRIDHRGVQVRAGLVAGTGGVDGPVRIAQQAHDRRPVVEVDHGRRGAAGGDGLGLGVVADERRHLVAVLLQFRQYVRSDEACCAGQCHFHAEVLLAIPPVQFKRLLEIITERS